MSKPAMNVYSETVIQKLVLKLLIQINNTVQLEKTYDSAVKYIYINMFTIVYYVV